LAEARIASAQTAFALAETSGPKVEQLALAQAQIDTVRANLEILQSQLERHQITAPFDGIIAEIGPKQGEWALPGKPLVTLLDPSRWHIENNNAGEFQISQIEIGKGRGSELKPSRISL
jgi:multidrug resistance efflux pump